MTALSPAVLTGLGALAGFLILWQWTERRDLREPPYVRSSVPFIGHVIGMVRFGAKYFEILNTETRHPIFALPMLGTRNYIVADPTFAGHVQRDSKRLSFYLLIVEVTRRLIAMDKDASRATFTDIHGEAGAGGLMAIVHEMMNRHLAPGPALDGMTRTQMAHTADKLNGLGPRTQTSLYAWLRHMFSWSNMQAIYGPQNIFATDSDLEESFWKFEDGMLGLVIDVLPQITARKAYRARAKVLDGLAEYVRDRRFESASPLIRERIQTNLEHGWSERMAGHGELVLIFAILGNAVPSLFWLIAMIFSDVKLLEQIRTEARNAMDVDQDQDGDGPDRPYRISVSSKQIQKLCPLLYSCYRETLRYISLLTSPRLVVEDTMLGDRYLLRKGSVVQIAGGVIHYDERIWGPDVASFNPYRFLSPGGQASDETETLGSRTAVPIPKGVPSPAYRAFGGGNVICPGRHFAQAELMTTVAVLALGFEIQSADGTGLQVPEKDDTRIPLSVMKPIHDPSVAITRRKGWEDVVWDIGV